MGKSADLRLAKRPVFIGGCPRSGTTLLASMIGTNPECVVTPESHFKFALLAKVKRGDPPLERAPLSQYLKADWRLGLWNLDLLSERIPDEILSAGATAIIAWVVHQYAKGHQREEARQWVDHTPSNLRWFQILHSAYPEARFIHLVRDGRAVISSVLSLDWGPASVIPAAWWWLGELSAGLAAEEMLPADLIMRVRFEDLLQSPGDTMAQVAEFLEFDSYPTRTIWDGFNPPPYTRSQHTLIGEPLDRGRIGGWRSSLSNRQVELIECFVGDLLGGLGYEQRFGGAARPPTWPEELAAHLRELWRFVPDRLSRRRRRRRK